MDINVNVRHIFTGGVEFRVVSQNDDEQRSMLRRILGEFVGIKAVLQVIDQKEDREMTTIAELKAKVAAGTSVIASVKTALAGLRDQVKALQPNQADIDELAANFDAEMADLANAVVENTPAAEDPEIPAADAGGTGTTGTTTDQGGQPA
jgi:chromosome segregation ATPase